MVFIHALKDILASKSHICNYLHTVSKCAEIITATWFSPTYLRVYLRQIHIIVIISVRLVFVLTKLRLRALTRTVNCIPVSKLHNCNYTKLVTISAWGVIITTRLVNVYALWRFRAASDGLLACKGHNYNYVQDIITISNR